MFVLKRNQIIITALVIMIAVAGYLNYVDGESAGTARLSEIPLNDQGEISALIPDYNLLSASSPVGSNFLYQGDNSSTISVDDNPVIDTEAEQTKGVSEPGEAVFVNTMLGSSYFVQAKLDREQSRAKQKEILTEMINNTNIELVKKAECADSMMDIQKRIEKETAAEAMIEAKGFSEVYVRIDDNSVDVVVSKEVLTDAEVAQIYDIVKRKTGMSEDKIHISPMRK